MAERRPLVIVAGQMQELPAGDTVPAPTTSNLISTPATIAADTSYVVMRYLKVTAALTVQGKVGVM